jgi:hypothetical protein
MGENGPESERARRTRAERRSLRRSAYKTSGDVTPGHPRAHGEMESGHRPGTFGGRRAVGRRGCFGQRCPRGASQRSYRANRIPSEPT